jgi:hypothetical protein
MLQHLLHWLHSMCGATKRVTYAVMCHSATCSTLAAAYDRVMLQRVLQRLHLYVPAATWATLAAYVGAMLLGVEPQVSHCAAQTSS